VAHSCGRCGETFEDAVDGGCPGCGRKLAAGARRPAVQRVYSEERGQSTWRLVALAVIAVLALLGWLVYRKVTAPPPAAAVQAPKKLLTLKDWRATIRPADLIPAMDALKALLDKAAEKTPLELMDALNRVVSGANQTDARIMLLSALEGRKGRAAGGVLSALCPRLLFYQHYGNADDFALLQKITLASVLEHVDSGDDDARQGVAFCLRELSGAWVTTDGRRLWEPEAGQKALMREAAGRLLKDKVPETRDCAEKALEKLR
jgi:hypothetical protein